MVAAGQAAQAVPLLQLVTATGQQQEALVVPAAMATQQEAHKELTQQRHCRPEEEEEVVARVTSSGTQVATAARSSQIMSRQAVQVVLRAVVATQAMQALLRQAVYFMEVLVVVVVAQARQVLRSGVVRAVPRAAVAVGLQEQTQQTPSSEVPAGTEW